jgi:hypothetical protein
LNNVVHDYGQSGIQINDGEFYYAIHNDTHGNSHATCDARGSGISMGFLKAKAGYALTADDKVNPNPMIGTLTPFRNLVTWNVSYNNNVGNCGISDGNGIILDQFGNDWNAFKMYQYETLVAFNVTYNNGGAGLDVFNSDKVTVANNSAYNNAIDNNVGGTFRPGLGNHRVTQAASVSYLNNIARGIPGSGNNAANTSYVLDNPPGSHGVTSNVAISDTPPAYNGAVFSCTANKCNATQSQYWTNVGNASNGNMNTPPNGANFALPKSSPAIGYGVTKPFLPAQSVDAGACHHSLTVCP